MHAELKVRLNENVLEQRLQMIFYDLKSWNLAKEK